MLILGESGTGKELVAQAIHQNSPRRDGPFVAVNCAAMPASLVESELFGHEKGSFTGARRQTHRPFESANGGTLFIDEIGDFDITRKVKLLRVLESRSFTPSAATRKSSGRYAASWPPPAATSANDGSKGTFREDLYLPPERHYD